MSVLLRANESSNPKDKMTDDELVDQVTCVTCRYALPMFVYVDDKTTARSFLLGMKLLPKLCCGISTQLRSIQRHRHASEKRSRLYVPEPPERSSPLQISIVWYILWLR